MLRSGNPEQIAIFLSTLPARGATFASRWPARPGFISIHAPREGSDISVCERCG